MIVAHHNDTGVTMNPATRTKRVKAALRAADVEILACYSEQREWTRTRVYNKVADDAIKALTDAGFTDVRPAGSGPHVTELNVWA